jgi:hypothetical protein
MVVKRSSKELTMISQTHDLLVWTLRHTARFPRSHRFGLGERIEVKLHAVMELLLGAKYASVNSGKAGLLQEAALRSEEYRFLLRAAHELGMLPHDSYGFAATQLDEISRQILAWKRSSSEANR